ncbi:phosphatase PAP2 family protein [Streptomyces sulfonofaciens]|uniref:phosphatase PAP2 family protein n=1 Tax=Streptomyces sulfonofaciens TaxID=68272 RepID=UPI0016771C41|nr:phosphatase PAP2 family protein [Streptomyces sulfonofaciens]
MPGAGLPLWFGLAAALAFAALSTVVALSSGRPLPWDGSTHAWGVQHRAPVAVAVARAVTRTGTGVLPYALVVLAGLLTGRGARGRLLAAAGCLACLVAGQAVRVTVLVLIARPRPPAADWATHASSWSFPSGHASTSAITAGVLVSALLLRSPPGRGPLVAVVGCWGAAVALTRVYLGVHWLTDIVGGWLFALAWLCLCGRALRPPVPSRRAGPG